MAERKIGNTAVQGYLKMVGGGDTYFGLPVVTTAQRDALTPFDGMAVFNSDTQGVEVHYEIDDTWRQINRPYVTIGSDTTTIIAGSGGTFQLNINLDKKGYFLGTLWLSSVSSSQSGGVTSFDRGGNWFTVESGIPNAAPQYARVWDSARHSAASGEWYSSTGLQIEVVSVQLNADGDTVEVVFKNVPAGNRTLHVKFRVVVW